MQLILASSSSYRRELLARLGLPFTCLSPDIDEAPRAGEAPRQLALRLAIGKAHIGAQMDSQICAGATTDDLASANIELAPRLVIGSDQVATLDGKSPLGKPETHQRAVEQLRAQSGRRVLFHTAVCLFDADTGRELSEVVDTEVVFRELRDETIEAYLHAEQPYDCAGAAKCEGLGIALLQSISGPDPTALIGLPLIAVSDMLARLGHPVI